jgi:hypothetical protein
MHSFHCSDAAFQLCYSNHSGILWDDLGDLVLVVFTLCWNPLGSRFGATHCVLEPSIPDILFLVWDDRGESFNTLHSVLNPSTPGIPFFCLWDDLGESLWYYSLCVRVNSWHLCFDGMIWGIVLVPFTLRCCPPIPSNDSSH